MHQPIDLVSFGKREPLVLPGHMVGGHEHGNGLLRHILRQSHNGYEFPLSVGGDSLMQCHDHGRARIPFDNRVVMANDDGVVNASGLANGLLETVVPRLILDAFLQVLLTRLRLAGTLKLKSNAGIVGIETYVPDGHGLVGYADAFPRYDQFLFWALCLCHRYLPGLVSITCKVDTVLILTDTMHTESNQSSPPHSG